MGGLAALTSPWQLLQQLTVLGEVVLGEEGQRALATQVLLVHGPASQGVVALPLTALVQRALVDLKIWKF